MNKQSWHRAVVFYNFVQYNVIWFDGFERLQRVTVRVISFKIMIFLIFLSFSSLLLLTNATKADNISSKCFMASSLTDLSTKLKICRSNQSFRENVRIYCYQSLVPLHLYRSESLLEIKGYRVMWDVYIRRICNNK